jgi:hypothetical protein
MLLCVDCFVIADTFPYSRQGYQNRCRIRTAQGQREGWAWLTVPLQAGAVGRPLRGLPIAEDGRWRRVHRKSLTHHYGSAPFYDHFSLEIDALLAGTPSSLAELTIATVRWTADALRAPAKIVPASELPGAPTTTSAVLEALGARTLVTLAESATPDRRSAAEVAVSSIVLHFTERPRRQNFPGFVPGCAALDLILNYGPEAPAHLAVEIGTSEHLGEP